MAEWLQLLRGLWRRKPATDDLERAPGATRALELAGRARLALELGQRALAPSEPLTYGPGTAPACELHRQALHWALQAHAALRAPVSTDGATTPGSAELAWDALAPEVLAEHAGDQSALEGLKRSLAGNAFAELAERPEVELRELTLRIGRLVEHLLIPFESRARRLERRWVRRTTALLAALACTGASAYGVRAYQLFRLSQVDYAEGAAWTTTTTFPFGGCKSPEQTCKGGDKYFFHTQTEENPAIVFDLRARKTISRVWVENRRDCCAERAVPLVVLVSTNQKSWKEVARITTEFEVWRAIFPEVRARYVKLMVENTAILHLAEVRILP